MTLDGFPVGFIDGAALFLHHDDGLAGVLGLLLGMSQGQLGHLFGHEGVEGILPLEVPEVPVRLVEDEGVRYHAGSPYDIGERLGRDAPQAGRGVHHPLAFCRRKKEIVRDQIAITFLARLVFDLPPNSVKRLCDPVLDESSLRLGGKLIGLVGGHFPEFDGLQTTGPQFGFLPVLHVSAQVIETNLSFLRFLSMAGNAVGLEERPDSFFKGIVSQGFRTRNEGHREEKISQNRHSFLSLSRAFFSASSLACRALEISVLVRVSPSPCLKTRRIPTCGV